MLAARREHRDADTASDSRTGDAQEPSTSRAWEMHPTYEAVVGFGQSLAAGSMLHLVACEA